MSNKTKQTAVEWLMSQAVNWARNTNSGNDIVEFPKDAIKQAKAMEKTQIKIAFLSGEHQQGFQGEAEQYYNETFKTKEK